MVLGIPSHLFLVFWYAWHEAPQNYFFLKKKPKRDVDTVASYLNDDWAGHWFNLLNTGMIPSLSALPIATFTLAPHIIFFLFP